MVLLIAAAVFLSRRYHTGVRFCCFFIETFVAIAAIALIGEAAVTVTFMIYAIAFDAFLIKAFVVAAVIVGLRRHLHRKYRSLLFFSGLISLHYAERINFRL